ncbi:MAG: prepilin peptidase, partial [Oribacterium sp.]
MKLSNLSPSFCCFLLFFSISALSDLRRKRIPRWIFWLFLPPGLISFLLPLLPPEKGGALSLLLLPLSLLPGFLLLLLSHFSRSALGRGDAVFFLISALYLPLRSLLFLLYSRKCPIAYLFNY